LRVGFTGPVLIEPIADLLLTETSEMPDITLTTAATTIIAVAVLLAVLCIAVGLLRSRRSAPLRPDKDSGPGPGFTYALVPPKGHPDRVGAEQQGSWQWCLAFIPEETADGGSAMPPWWAPPPPWDSAADTGRSFTEDAEALCAMFEETSDYPVAKSKAG